jgi:hypothetical protein
MQSMAFRMPVRRMATAARSSLKIGLIPADGIGREVIPVRLRINYVTHPLSVIRLLGQPLRHLGRMFRNSSSSTFRQALNTSKRRALHSQRKPSGPSIMHTRYLLPLKRV